jgi:hypothetical protein
VKLSDLSPDEWYARLSNRISEQRKSALLWWQYMDLEQPLVYVARIIAEQDGRFPPLLLPWSELVIQSVVERQKFESFLLAEKPITELDKSWQDNNLDELSDEAHTAMQVSGLHFLMVGPDGPGGSPLVTTEYADQVAVELDPRTRQPIAGLKIFQEDTGVGESEQRAFLYLPHVPTVAGETGPCRVFELDGQGKMKRVEDLGDWSRVLAEDPSLPSVPLVPMLANPRRGFGRSDLVQLKPALDGANQFATNLMAAGEHHAVQRKWVVGATEKDFVDENGNQVPLWKVAMGDVWGIPHTKPDGRNQNVPETKVGQFAASDLRNFHESHKLLAQVAASAYGLPPSYMGYSSDNPPSAEAILYALERLVLRTGKRNLWAGGSWKQAGRIQYAILEKDPSSISAMEAKWANPATLTLAAKMDAAVKGTQSGIIDNEQAWIDLGYSEQTKKGLRERMGQRSAQFQRTALNLRGIDVNAEDSTDDTGAPDAPAAVSA